MPANRSHRQLALRAETKQPLLHRGFGYRTCSVARSAFVRLH